MRDEDKTKEALIEELREMRRQVSKLRKAEVRGQTGNTLGGSNMLNIGAVLTRGKKLEAHLQESIDTIEALLNATTDMVYLIDPDGTVIVANHRGVESLGGSHQKLIGASIFDFLPPKLATERREKLDEVIRLGSPLIYEDKHYVRHFEHSLYPILGREGVQRIAVYSRDITDRKRAANALEESREKYKRLIEMMNEGLWVQDENGIISYVNDRFCEILGHSSSDMIGRRVADFLDKPNLEKLADRLDRGTQRGAPSCEIEWSCRDGRKVWTIVAPRLLYDAEGVFLGSVAVITDITERKRSEEALREREEFLSSIVENIPDMIFIKDAKELRFVRFNKAGEELLGYKRKDLIGKNDYDFFPEEQADFFTKKDREVLESGHVYDVPEEPIDTKTGRRILHTKKIPILDKNGNPAYLLGISEDITERKRAETELRKSSDLLRAIIEAAPTPIIGLDLNGNVQLVWNPAAEKMLGWSAQEAMGRPLPSVPAEKQEEFRGFRERIRSGKTLDGVEVRRQKRDGTPIDYSIYASPLHDAEGRITGNVCVLVDMTDRKRAEQALRASEEKYRTLFEESIDGVYSVLRDGQITDANSSFCDIFGYTRQEMIGKDVLELYVDPADRQRFQKEIEKRGFVKDYEIKLRKRDGTELDCLLSSSVYFGADRSIAGYRGILRDLTLHKALQRQLLQAQKMESLGTLAGGIAHDFNNLLQVIIGYSDMLLFNKKPSDKEYEGLHAIGQAGRDGSELAKRILAFSRRLAPDTRPVDLNNEIERVQKMLERTVPKMIGIEILLADNLMAVNADPSQMEQIILNLAVNAQHAMPDGGRLTIETANVTLDEDYSRTHLDVEPGRYVLLSVSDTGHGMDKEVLEHIFEPFYTTKGAEEGTGLGLAMVFGIVKSHKGHIICYSEPGAGTTFKIYLPAIVREIEPDVAVTQQVPAFGTETILLVDDEESIRKLGEQMLRVAGYTVLTATNGREALEIYRSNQDRIGLVLLDLMMPEMGGKQCLEELLKINPRVRVVIASGYSANGPTKDALASGAKRFVDKPYDIRQVLEAVREVLDAE